MTRHLLRALAIAALAWPLAAAAQVRAESGGDDGQETIMKKERARKDDERYLIYYSFDESELSPTKPGWRAKAHPYGKQRNGSPRVGASKPVVRGKR